MDTPSVSPDCIVASNWSIFCLFGSSSRGGSISKDIAATIKDRSEINQTN